MKVKINKEVLVRENAVNLPAIEGGNFLSVDIIKAFESDLNDEGYSLEPKIRRKLFFISLDQFTEWAQELFSVISNGATAHNLSAILSSEEKPTTAIDELMDYWCDDFILKSKDDFKEIKALPDKVGVHNEIF